MNVLLPESPAVAAGVGLFETMLIAGERVLHLDEHAARMADSCTALGFPPLDHAAFRDVATRAARGAEGEAAVRVVRAAANTKDWLLDGHRFPIPSATLSRRRYGRAVTLDPTIARSLPRYKLTSYAVCAIALRDAVAAGADESLFVTHDSAILEGTATNVFAVRGQTLVTAPLSAGILPGIVRAWVLAAASAIGIAIEERAPSRSEIYEGAFFTGSLTTLAPLRALDGRSCAPPGDVFAELARRYGVDASSRS